MAVASMRRIGSRVSVRCMLAYLDWSPERFAAVLAEIRIVMGLSAAELGRLAGISRSQASRWSRGENQPAYQNVRQLGIAVYRDWPDLAQHLMESAGYPRITEDDAARADAPLVPEDEWEAGVLADPDLPDHLRRRLVTDSRAARAEYARLRAERRAARARGQAS